MRRSRRLLAFPVGIAALAAAVAASNTPASGAAPGHKAVDGLHQAYIAEPYKGAAVEPTFEATKRFFTGTAADQANKVAGTPTATFDAEEPSGTTVTQEASSFGNSQDPADRLAAKWSGPYAGLIDGPVELEWYWTSAAGAVGGIGVEVSFIADPGTEQQAVLGTGIVTIDATGTEPQRNVSRLRIKGNVASTLMVQANAQYVDTGAGLRVHYGSAEAPSSIALPTEVVGPPARQDNDPAPYTGPPLEVSATYIGREAAEPTLGVTKSGTSFMAAGAFDALPQGSPTNLARTEIWRSQDGGLTWGSVQQKAPGGFTTLPPTTLDPYVWVDEDTGRVFTPDLYVGCNYLQWSDDEGETWQQQPIACGSPVNDHQTVVTGPPPEGVTLTGSYPNVVYYCFNRVADASCGRSLDGGFTWLPAGAPAFLGVDGGLCGGLHGHIVTDKLGRLYMPKGHCEKPWLGISDDAGETWRTYKVHDGFKTGLLSTGSHTAVDVDEAGTIYYLWQHIADFSPLLSYSKDGGETWSEPVLVSPPGVKEANLATIDAGKPGQIAISFPGSTVGGTEANRPWNYYVLTSLNADTPEPLFVSTTANPLSDPIHRGNCGPGRCAGMYDFLDIEFSPTGEIWAAATDTCTAEADCNTADGVRAPSAEGVSVRQLSGPGMDDVPVPRPGPTGPKPKPDPKPDPKPAPLPSTGTAAWVMWLAAAGVALGLGGRRRIRTG